MNIALVCQNVVRHEGHGRANCEVVEEALRQGHRVTIVSHLLEPELEAHPGVTWIKIDVKRWPSQLLKDLVFVRQSTRYLRRHRDRFDAVFVTGYVTREPADVCMVQFVHRAWMDSPVHTARVRGGLYGLYQKLYSLLNIRWEAHTFRHAGTVVAVSHKIREELEALGVPPRRIRVLTNGVDSDEFHPGHPDRSALGLPEDVPLAFFAGDIRTPRKNLGTVLKALTDVPGLHLAVAGGTERSPYPAMAERLGLTDRVHFLGFRRDMPALMRASDLFVFPSRYEACTLVLLEALASGVPAISAKTAGGAEIMNEDCGFVLDDPNDAEALAEKMRLLTTDADLRARMGQAARALAEEHTWQDMARRYVQLFEEAAATPSAAQPAVAA